MKRDNKGRFLKGSSGFIGKHTKESREKMSLSNKNMSKEKRQNMVDGLKKYYETHDNWRKGKINGINRFRGDVMCQ